MTRLETMRNGTGRARFAALRAAAMCRHLFPASFPVSFLASAVLSVRVGGLRLSHP